jgi:YVTN family beta-propeller protein
MQNRTYVVGDGVMYTINDETNAVINTSQDQVYGSCPQYVESSSAGCAAIFDTRNGVLYITVSNGVAVVNVSTGEVVEIIRPSNASAPFLPGAMVLDTMTGQIFVGQERTSIAGYSTAVYVIDDTTNSFQSNFTLPGTSEGMSYDPARNVVYIASFETDRVYAVNATDDALLASVAVPSGPTGVAYDPTNNLVYVADSASNSVAVINASNYELVSTIALGSSPLCVSVAGSTGKVFVTIPGSDSVAVISGTGFAGEISVGQDPSFIVYDDAQNSILVGNAGSGTLSLVPLDYYYYYSG